MAAVPARLDHLVYAAPDLAAAVSELERQTGVRALPGGAHPAWGTRNAIFPLGARRYLEVIGPDPQRPGAAPPELFGISSLTAPRLVTWAAVGHNLETFVATAQDLGLDLGGAMPGSRVRPDGAVLRWTLTDPLRPREGGVIPFFIDWGEGPHPGDSALTGLRLAGLQAEHPEPERVGPLLAALGLDLDLVPGRRARLRVSLRTPGGTLTLA